MSVIIHLDMNAFFASVEQEINPRLKGKPIAVCGKGRTVVAAASYEARRYGVKTGMNLYEARKLCPDIIAVIGDHARYESVSERMQKICLSYTPYVEVFSIDEVFMDISGSISHFGSPLEIARGLKNRIKKELGLTCSIGIAPGKLLAKLASEREKPDGLVVFEADEISEILSYTPVGDLCGIGPKTTASLNALGINTLGELSQAPESMLIRKFGFIAHLLKMSARGLDSSPVAKYSDKKQVKSVGNSSTFPENTRDINLIKSYIYILSERAAYRMRAKKKVGRCISLYIRYNDFSGSSKSRRLETSLKTSGEIFNLASLLFEKFLPLSRSVRMAGISITSLEDDRGQEDLFQDRRKELRLTEATDRINSKFGEMTLRPLSFDIALRSSGKNENLLVRTPGFQEGTRGRL
ncbi:MAG: DNA polymerase IV [Elusimicrobia bacterium]|nr:DNA polymerase IV [Elusimicrobiota bacterium]